MAVVPRVSGPQVQRQAIPGARVEDQGYARASAGLQQGIQNLGQAAIGIAQREQEKAELAQVLEAKRRLGDWERSWFDPANEQGVYAAKGRDALQITDRLGDDYERVQAEIAGSIKSPRAQARFQELALATRESVLGRAQSYAVREHDAYVQAEFQASIASATESAARAAVEGRADDQAREMQYGLTILRAAAATQGEPPELTRQKEQAYVSGVHATALSGLLAQGRVDEATAYLDANGEGLTVKDAAEVTARLRPLQLEALADAMVWGAQAGVTPADVGADLTLDDIWPSLERQESGSLGQAAVSPKGATGVAQVMPATGPEAARLAGLPWDPQRFKQDEDYNRALGRAYMGEQLRVFGSMPLALAAYNAGPGAVQKWLRTIGDPRRGEISVQEFVERIPYKETREYVGKIYERGGFALGSGSPAVAASQARAAGLPGPEVPLSQQLAAVRQVGDVQLRRRLEAGVRERHALQEAEKRQRIEQSLESITQKVWTAPVGQPLSSVLTPDELAFITQRGQLPAFQKVVRDRIEGTLPQTDAVLFDDLRRMSVDDPQRFAQMRGYIVENRARFSASDYETLLSRQAALAQGDTKASADWATQAERIDGIVTGLQLKKETEKAAVAMAWQQAERALIQTLDGKKPKPEQLDELARRVRSHIARRIADGEPWVQQYAQYEADAAALPRAERERIRRGLIAAGIPDPTEADILDYYNDQRARR